MSEIEDLIRRIAREEIGAALGKPGWNNDCNYPGYGLTKKAALELAEAANAARGRRRGDELT